MSISFNKDWSQFTRRIFIKAPVERVFNAWALQGQMEDWFLLKAQFSRKDSPLLKDEMVAAGDSFHWIWHGWDDADQRGEVLSVIKNKQLSMTFKPAGIVTVDFEQTDDNFTHLILHQSSIPTDEDGKLNFFYGCSLGWSFWMVNLKAWLEHGILLDERDVNFDDNRKLEVVNH